MPQRFLPVLMMSLLPAIALSLPSSSSGGGGSGSGALTPGGSGSGSGNGQFVPAGPNDKRSPCPGLNTLANHGYLPHNGTGITKDQLAQAIRKGFGTSDVFATAFAAVAHPIFADKQGFMSLADLSRRLEDNPSGVEHRASLSRKDKNAQGDQTKPDKDRVEYVLKNCSKDGKFFTLEDMTACRTKLNGETEKAEPTVVKDPLWTKAKVIAFMEGTLAEQIFSGGDNRNGAPLGHLRSFLAEETFPPTYKKLDDWGITNFVAAVVKAEASAVGNSWVAWIKGAAKTVFEAPSLLARLFGKA